MTKHGILLFLVFSLQLFSDENLLPVSYEGRFRPLEVIQNKPDLSDLKMLPSKKKPAIWLPLSSLEGPSNPTPFSNETWDSLKQSYLIWKTDPKGGAAFADIYFKAYAPLTEKRYPLSSETYLTYPSLRQLEAEALYYRIPFTSLAVVGYLLATFFFTLAMGFQNKTLKIFGFIAAAAAFISHTLALLLRIYILERPPVSNMGETMIYVPWIALLVAAFFSMRLGSLIPLAAATTLAAVLLTLLEWTLGAYSLENVQAVLNSQVWLTIHVLMIVASYGVLIFAGILGHIELFSRLLKRPLDLSQAILQSIYLGVALLIPGTILGGVWAAQSWGRFWDWDPKESWAFISACVYLIVIHSYRFKKIGSLGLAIGSIAGLLAISFTWYGVNYILGTGLHSYGFGSGGEWIYFSFLGLETIFIALALFSPRNQIE